MIPTWRPRRAALATSLVEFLLRGGVLEGAGLHLRAAHGRGGIVPAAQKREGDGGTPSGLLRLTRVLYRADRMQAPVCAVPVEPIAPRDGWCDDMADPAYNKQIRLPFAPGHEALWRDDHVYDVIGVLDWNFAPIIPGKGSAIFFHAATPDYAPTAGCVALNLADMLAALSAGMSAIRVPD
jgi:L,D-peptidoglycan transpeptidase YkuD (ErfK/YbiS/YcfS/YnhG family)